VDKATKASARVHAPFRISLEPPIRLRTTRAAWRQSGSAVTRRGSGPWQTDPMPERESSGSEAITAEGLEALREEVARLEGPARQEMAARIKAARELGDLKENADYHIAKEDQAHLETRISRLRVRLRSAEVVETDASAETFAFGRTAEVVDESSGKVNTWTLVGATEADLGAGRLSAESPVGSALRDAGVGQTVRVETPRGEKSFTVQRLVG
jgi:transcription elongation factor GreA